MTDSNSKDSVLGIPFYRFYYDESKRDAVYNSVKNLSYRHNDTNWIWRGVTLNGVGGSELHKLPEFAELVEWFQQCMNEVAEDMGMTCKLACNSCWSHLNKPGDYLYEHIHTNSFISANYYVSGHSVDQTVWTHVNPYFRDTNLRPCGDGKEENYYLTYKEPTEPGKFVVFPSAIRHRSEANTSRDNRYTISSNWFPSGFINESGVSHLNIEVL